MIKVSIIVPVYNGQDYLRTALSCLTSQTLSDIEIICVNDCSTDDSLTLIKEIAKDDSRIRVIDCKTNGGESKARNIGINAATGEYIAFMDQDDRVDLDFYEKLYTKALETGADIAKGDSFDVFYDGRIFPATRTPVSKHPLFFASNWWTGIYRRSMVTKNNILLPEDYPLGGDLKFLFDVGRVANKVSTDYSVHYHHIMHEDSGDAAKTSTPKAKSLLKIFKYILDNAENEDYFHTNPEIYEFFYFNCFLHLAGRILKCEELEGRLLCADFIFDNFKVCKCKEYILRCPEERNSLLLSALKEDNRDFYKKLFSLDELSDLFYSRNRSGKEHLEKCAIIVPFVKKELVDKYILKNRFLRDEEALSVNLIDNTAENRALSVLYNEFLDKYDYSNESWFIFAHSDFEFLEFPSNILHGLDKSRIYGPVGVKTFIENGKAGFFSKGRVYEKDAQNILYENFPHRYEDPSVDTLDCMCMLVHSSLIDKYHLRFDEALYFDLYVEDFCIDAAKEHGVGISALSFDCAHHSSYVSEKYCRNSYLDRLKYINSKYPNDIYGGTVTPIGGKALPQMNDREMLMFAIRHEMKTGKKL